MVNDTIPHKIVYLSEQKKKSNSAVFIQQIVKLIQKSSYTLQKIGLSFIKQNKIEKAFKHINLAIKLDKREGFNCYIQGRLYQALLTT